MAQKRMLDKKISVNESVANLSVEAQLLFTWMIPHADDLGLLPDSARTIKAMVVPMWDVTADSIGIHLESMISMGLLERGSIDDETFLRIVKFSENQTLKNDRKPQTIASNITDWKTLESKWKTVESKWKNLELQDKRREVKIREDNLREEKRREDLVNKEQALVEDLAYPKEFGNPEINECMKILKDSGLPVTKTQLQRFALNRLIRAYGKDKTQQRMKIGLEISGKRYAPVIANYLDLEQKWASLEAYVSREISKEGGVYDATAIS